MCIQRVAYTLQNIGLALTIGGILGLGAFAAPVIFHTFPIKEAGAAMTVVFRRYDIVLSIALALILFGEAVRFKFQRFSTWRYLVVGLFTVASLYSLICLHPRMEAAQKAGVIRYVGAEGQAFNRIHHFSESMFKAQLLLALILLVMTPPALASIEKNPLDKTL